MPAAISTLTKTAQPDVFDPEARQRDVLTRLADEHRGNRIGKLTL